jgi:hypothetical protein
MNGKPDAIVFDVDGTLCDISTRIQLTKTMQKLVKLDLNKNMKTYDDLLYLQSLIQKIERVDRLIYETEKKTKNPLFRLLGIKHNEFMNLLDEFDNVLNKKNMSDAIKISRIKFHLKPFSLKSIKKVHDIQAKTHYSCFMDQLDKVIEGGLDYIKFLRQYYPNVIIIYLTGRLNVRQSRYKEKTIEWLQSNGFPMDMRVAEPIYFQRGFSNTTMLNIVNMKKICEQFNVLFMIGDNHKDSDQKACLHHDINFVLVTRNYWLQKPVEDESIQKYFYLTE